MRGIALAGSLCLLERGGRGQYSRQRLPGRRRRLVLRRAARRSVRAVDAQRQRGAILLALQERDAGRLLVRQFGPAKGFCPRNGGRCRYEASVPVGEFWHTRLKG
jgi:hypothetical protein